MSKLDIFKGQLPISTNAKKPVALFYNEDRSIEFDMPVSKAKDLFPSGMFKIFVVGELGKQFYGDKERNVLIITEIIINEDEWPNW